MQEGPLFPFTPEHWTDAGSCRALRQAIVMEEAKVLASCIKEEAAGAQGPKSRQQASHPDV